MSYFWNEKQQEPYFGRLLPVLLAAFMLLIAAGMWGCPVYNVWSESKAGQAELARAEFNRKVAVQEAEAKRESASKLAEADTVRAMGIAASNRIIGQSLEQNPAYLTWLYYENLKETSNQVIYVPTEASLPITEATRHEQP